MNPLDYGKELILDIHHCKRGCKRATLTLFFRELCDLIDMKREALHFWDYEGDPRSYRKAPPHLKGTSAVQFISTSNITVHVLDDLKKVYVNVFSCKEFNSHNVADFCEGFFKGELVTMQTVRRL